VQPIAVSLIIARLVANDFYGAQQAVVIFIASSLLMGILGPAIKYVGMKGENSVYSDMAAKYFSSLINADLEYFNSNLSGYLTAATRQYVDECIAFIRTLRDRFLVTIISIIFPFCAIMWLDWRIGIMTFVLSSAQAIYLLWASHIISPYRVRCREVYRAISGRISDAISNILVVKSTAQEKFFINRMEQDMSYEVKMFTKRFLIHAETVAVRDFITLIFFAALLFLTVQHAHEGYLDIAGTILVINFMISVISGIYEIADNLEDHDNMIDKIIPAFDLLDRQNLVCDPKHPREFQKIRGKIDIQDVSFSYDKNGDDSVLSNLSLSIPHGQKVGVVGLSGAGKSTITRLLLRFNDVNSGKIMIDGTDIRMVRQSDLRSQIAYVPQEPLLFHNSIRENVLVSRPDASDDEINRALKASHAYRFVKQLPDGINSVVGERGVKLSGGQKQRIAIARAVLQNAPIMILDEATSALDSESEQIIKDSFKDILRGKTAIVVAHRLSTLSEMDRIIVIDDGKLIEDGTHEELLIADGVYARLWNRQQKNIET
jgi:ATP-binding cassette subfamily B protein